MREPASVLVRVWLPDRPGALGLVASRIGAVRGDIVGIDVLERGDGLVIDEFAVRLSDPEVLSVLVREVDEVDGVAVEEVRFVDHFPDPRLDALDSATALCEATTPEALAEHLVALVRAEFVADWSALAQGGRSIAQAGDAPDPPAAPAVGDERPDHASSALPRHDAVLHLGRDGHPFRDRERAQLAALARVADRVWQLLHDARPSA